VQERRYDQFARRALRACEQGRRLRRRSVQRLVLAHGFQVMNLDPACFFAAIFWGKKLHEIKSEEKTRAHRVPFTFLLLAHTRTQISVVLVLRKAIKQRGRTRQ